MQSYSKPCSPLQFAPTQAFVRVGARVTNSVVLSPQPRPTDTNPRSTSRRRKDVRRLQLNSVLRRFLGSIFLFSMPC